MASPLPSRKQSVDLAAPVVRVSRIRRDPPPPVKEVSVAEIKERDARAMVIGISAFAILLVALLIGIANASGWSLSQYPIHIRVDE